MEIVPESVVYLPDHADDILEGRDGALDTLAYVAAECWIAATAAERERLMEVVCEQCGKQGHDRADRHGTVWHEYLPVGSSIPMFERVREVAYAEYLRLRLHPEAGEGG